MQAELRETTDELGWYFGSSEAAIGIHGQGIDPDTTGGVFDDARSHRLHISKRLPAHTQAVERRAKVESVLWGLDLPHQRVVKQAFEPFGVARASLFAQDAFTRHGRCLMLIALETTAARVLFGRAHESMVKPMPMVMQRFLEDEAGKNSSRLRVIADEAERTLNAAMNAYDARRQERVYAERQAGQAEIAKIYLRIRGGT